MDILLKVQGSALGGLAVEVEPALSEERAREQSTCKRPEAASAACGFPACAKDLAKTQSPLAAGRSDPCQRPRIRESAFHRSPMKPELRQILAQSQLSYGRDPGRDLASEASETRKVDCLSSGLCPRICRLLEESRIVAPKVMPYGTYVCNVYAIFSPKRDDIHEALLAKDVQTGIHYPLPVHLLEVPKNLGYHGGDSVSRTDRNRRTQPPDLSRVFPN
jgi:hypothetical protein